MDRRRFGMPVLVEPHPQRKGSLPTPGSRIVMGVYMITPRASIHEKTHRRTATAVPRLSLRVR